MQPIFQERFRTEQTRARITHVRNIEDVVLNTAQMRDAVHVQKFRVDSEALDLDQIVYKSAADELAARKAGELVPSEILAGKTKSRRTPAVAVGAAGPSSSQSRVVPLRVTVLQSEQGQPGEPR